MNPLSACSVLFALIYVFTSQLAFPAEEKSTHGTIEAHAEATAHELGFIRPQIHLIPLQVGETFVDRGDTSTGSRYEMSYEIVAIGQGTISLAVNGTIKGRMNGEIKNALFVFPLAPNTPTIIPKYINFGQPTRYIAFISPNPAEFRPKLGDKVIIALGDVRDTVPPPPKK